MKRTIAFTIAAAMLATAPAFAQDQSAPPYLQAAPEQAKSWPPYVSLSAVRMMSPQQLLKIKEQTNAREYSWATPYLYMPRITLPHGAVPGGEIPVYLEGVVQVSEFATPYIPLRAHRIVVERIKFGNTTANGS